MHCKAHCPDQALPCPQVFDAVKQWRNMLPVAEVVGQDALDANAAQLMGMNVHTRGRHSENQLIAMRVRTGATAAAAYSRLSVCLSVHISAVATVILTRPTPSCPTPGRPAQNEARLEEEKQRKIKEGERVAKWHEAQARRQESLQAEKVAAEAELAEERRRMRGLQAALDLATAARDAPKVKAEPRAAARAKVATISGSDEDMPLAAGGLS